MNEVKECEVNATEKKHTKFTLILTRHAHFYFQSFAMGTRERKWQKQYNKFDV